MYQNAKLRMLQFYFDFLDVFMHRSDFEYVQMDTDSAYFALSGTSVESLVKPELRQRFEKENTIGFHGLTRMGAGVMINGHPVSLNWNGKARELWHCVVKPGTVLVQKTSLVAKERTRRIMTLPMRNTNVC